MKYNTNKTYNHSNNEPNINNNSQGSTSEKRLLFKKFNSIKKSNSIKNSPYERVEHMQENPTVTPEMSKQMEEMIRYTKSNLWESGEKSPFPPFLVIEEKTDENPNNNSLTISSFSIQDGYCETPMVDSTAGLPAPSTPNVWTAMNSCHYSSDCAGVRVSETTKNHREVRYELIKQIQPGKSSCLGKPPWGNDLKSRIKRFTAYKSTGTIYGPEVTGLPSYLRDDVNKTRADASIIWEKRKNHGQLLRDHVDTISVNSELPTSVARDGDDVAVVPMGTGCPKFPNEGEFLNKFSPVDPDFFLSYSGIPGILSGYNPESLVGISKQFPPNDYFRKSTSRASEQWNLKAHGLTKIEIIQRNPIITTWSPNLGGGEKFIITIAQMYNPKPPLSFNPDVLGFKIIAGIPENEPDQEYGFIQWYKDSFQCAVTDVYKFKLGYANISETYLSLLPPHYRGVGRGAATGAGEGPGKAPKGEGPGTGGLPRCPESCLNPHRDAWWKDTSNILWSYEGHDYKAALKLKEKMYPSTNLDDIIHIINDTYDIYDANTIDKDRLYERHQDDAAIHCVRNAYVELSREINGKLKLSSKNMVREVWLRKLMKFITIEYMRYHFEPTLKKAEDDIDAWWNGDSKAGRQPISEQSHDQKKVYIEALISVATGKAKSIFGLLSKHLDELHVIWETANYGSPPLYVSSILDLFVKSSLDKYKTTILKRYDLYESMPPSTPPGTPAKVKKAKGLVAPPVDVSPPVGAGQASKGITDGVGSNKISPASSGPFGGMSFKEEEMLFFKRNAKKIMVAIIKDTPFPIEVLDELEARAGDDAETREEVIQEINEDFNAKLKQVTGDNAPVIDINTSKMSELFNAFSIIEPDNTTELQNKMNQVMAFLAINMNGDEEWIVEQFREIQKSRYKDTRVVKFAIQFIKKLADTIESEQKIEQKIELDVEQVEKIGEAINETETPPEDLEKELELAREEVRQTCKNDAETKLAQIEELREDLQKEKDKIEGKDSTIKYGAIGAGVVIILLILYLLMK